MKVRAHILVGGRVQGVFFRSKTRDEAVKKNLYGWVKNLPDGQVEAVFEGEKENVEKMIEFCKMGPSGAKVTKVVVHWQNFTGEFKNFTINYGYS